MTINNLSCDLKASRRTCQWSVGETIVTVREARGVYAAALTPLDARLAPDLQRVTAHCRWLLAHGCDGINLLGTTGEATSLSTAQRLAVMEAVAQSALPLGRFMVGTGASALADAVTLTTRAVDLGFSGALVIPPFYFKNVTDGGVFEYFVALIERVARPGLRLYLYHFPALSGVPFTLPLIERLVERYPGVIAGLKDSSGDVEYANRVAAAFRNLAIFPSTEAALAGAREAGYAGCISATVNVTAPLAGAVWRASADDADRETAQASLARIRATIAGYPLVPALRHLVARLRGDAAWCHVLPPLAALSAADAATLDDTLAQQPAFATIEAAFAPAAERA